MTSGIRSTIPRTQISIHLDDNVLYKIEARARHRGITKNEMVCYLVELAVNHLDDKDSKDKP